MDHSADHSRNLLFGLLALQNGLIDQDQLISAFRAWSRDKTRPMPELLREQKAIDDSDRDVLEALVGRHLTRHSSEPERSLAALDLSGATRQKLANVGDPEIDATLARAVSAERDQADRTTTYSVGISTSDGQRFRAVRPLARGGLGEVFVAIDTELHREVALKQMLDRLGDDSISRARFVAEAEITGGLEHPGVVPVYGLGCDRDNQPYYAMRLIKGESLKEAIQRYHAEADAPGQALALRGLLNRFVAVCYAIAYAHSRGVIHRDIKPANVMLGPYGETLVVDWGLAKVIGREETDASAEATLRPGSGSSVNQTIAGSAIGTPVYMSPEQAEGKLDAIGPPSDVYSLGATLYFLTTGKPPFSGDDVGDILKRVARGHFPHPRAINSHVPRTLDAVCLKAMSLKPSDRYTSARALAEDVEHWLADEPVAAFREPLPSRIIRWGKRHKSSVAAAVALLLTAVVALTIGTILLQRANARTQRERDLARQNFTMARRAVDDYLTRVGRNPLLKEQGLHDLRQELLEAALTYYQDFLRQQGDSPGVRAETAAAFERVGDIHRELGRFNDAVAAYDQGLALARTLPDKTDATTVRLRMEGSRIAALTLLDQFDEAVASYERASASVPENLAAAIRFVLIKLDNAGAEAYTRSGRADEGLRASQRALKSAESYTRDHPDNTEALYDLMIAYTYTARKLCLGGHGEEAMKIGNRGRERGEALILEHPRDIDLRVALSDLVSNLTDIELDQHHPESVLIHARRSVSLLEDICRENPLLFGPRLLLSNALSTQSNMECGQGQMAESRKSAEWAVEIARDLLRQSPKLPRLQENLGVSLISRGRALCRSGDMTGALKALKEAPGLMEHSGECVYIYNAACSLSLASSIDDPTELGAPTDRQARRSRDADRAIELLKKAIDHGISEPNMLRADPDLAPLQSRADFQALIRLLETKKKTGAAPDRRDQ